MGQLFWGRFPLCTYISVFSLSSTFCVCMCVRVCLCEHVEARGPLWVSSSISFHPHFFDEPENLVLSSELELTDSARLSDQRAPCVSPTPVPGLQVNAISPACWCGFWRIKSGILPTKLSFQPHNLRPFFFHMSSPLIFDSTGCGLGRHLPSPLAFRPAVERTPFSLLFKHVNLG